MDELQAYKQLDHKAQILIIILITEIAITRFKISIQWGEKKMYQSPFSEWDK